MNILQRFVAESNRIEGIDRAPTEREFEAHAEFFELKRITIEALQEFVYAVAPYAELRTREGMDVVVGNHRPPAGGPYIARDLDAILDLTRRDPKLNPYHVHCRYETLHPFMDGNGRSGRAVWAWQMINQPWWDPHAMRRGFLWSWYYQSLEFAEGRK